MIIKREVLLKAIVTEKLKAQLTESVDGTIQQLNEAQEEMERQYRRLMLEVQRMDAGRAMAVRQQVDLERRKRYYHAVLEQMRADAGAPKGKWDIPDDVRKRLEEQRREPGSEE